MQLALQLAELGRGQTSPNPVVGALLVRDGRIVGQGAHLRAGEAHAEVHALRMAGEAARGATAYVTLEPCSHFGRTPPCADALIAAGIRRVVVAAADVNPAVGGRGIERLRAAGVEVRTGVCEAQALRQNEAFRTWVLHHRPFVVWKCAATLDGRIAADSGHSQYVTGAVARASVQDLRRTVDAIAVGAETAIADDPRLTVRRHGEAETAHQPLRVVFDARLRLPAHLQMLREPGRTLVYTTAEAAAEDEARLRAVGAEVVRVATDIDGRVSVRAALADLAERGVCNLLLEGGSHLATAFWQAQLVDKVVYYVAPKLLGSGVPALRGPATDHMQQAIPLAEVTWAACGEDLRVEGYPVYACPNHVSSGRRANDVHGTD
ncbi:MAG: bifunctional diaminohydroxyphosphoribosylaminopyrimidine deaminase/5-amino-6-(5-phosphoribosylamino)uracil reductase RibD [Alicyclobacillus sp.]|nr:bifunctional diaminohydroxyphosphoribosylaminopyrimidine deaminase/5-amino-6-(5-phosphoribosylamino)uracil reductase RibD [Alicyclobacillus sp.]